MTSSVNVIAQLGETHLPDGVECSCCVFMPEAMFIPHQRAASIRAVASQWLLVGHRASVLVYCHSILNSVKYLKVCQTGHVPYLLGHTKI